MCGLSATVWGRFASILEWPSKHLRMTELVTPNSGRFYPYFRLLDATAASMCLIRPDVLSSQAAI